VPRPVAFLVGDKLLLLRACCLLLQSCSTKDGGDLASSYTRYSRALDCSAASGMLLLQCSGTSYQHLRQPRRHHVLKLQLSCKAGCPATLTHQDPNNPANIFHTLLAQLYIITPPGHWLCSCMAHQCNCTACTLRLYRLAATCGPCICTAYTFVLYCLLMHL
jgi:hypothetical protein